MKKLLSILLCAALVLGLAACGTAAVEQVQPDVQQMLEVHRIASFFIAGVSPPCIGP